MCIVKMTNILDYYDVLGCSKGSSHEELKHAYRTRALLCHPDKDQTVKNDASEFQRLTEAWKVLGQPESRKQYDTDYKQAEWDSQSAPVYSRISASELERTVDESTMMYQCRCGSAYYVERECLKQKNKIIHVSCEECSFIIVVET